MTPKFYLNLLPLWRQNHVQCSEPEICSIAKYQTIAMAETTRWLPSMILNFPFNRTPILLAAILFSPWREIALLLFRIWENTWYFVQLNIRESCWAKLSKMGSNLMWNVPFASCSSLFPARTQKLAGMKMKVTCKDSRKRILQPQKPPLPLSSL